MVRTGIGFDAHRFAAGRKLMLGGIEIKYPLGLEGHSDADVVCHAIIDALLGAAGLGDIGRLFPNSDPAYKNISSMLLLAKAKVMLEDRKYEIINIDVTVIAEEPKIAPYVDRMSKTIADALSLADNSVNIKGKTTERLGFTGRKEGIAALAIATVSKK
jgi:2-C-methyl-D-erythritol 2,4-cyclodiphosphate synthase